MLLRIDDTDAERTVAGAEEAILADLGWLGIGWDEGPVRQSSRAERHVEAANLAGHTTIRDGALYLSPPGVRAVRDRARRRPPHLSLGDRRRRSRLRDHPRHPRRRPPRQRGPARRRVPRARRRAARLHPPRRRPRRRVASCRNGRATPRSPTCARPAIRHRPSSTCWGWSQAPGRARCSTWTSSWRGSTPTGSRAATSASTRPACARSRPCTWPGWGTPSWRRPCCPSAGRGRRPPRSRRWRRRSAARTRLAEAAGLVACVLDAPAERPTLPELAELRKSLPEQLDEMQARELVDELRRRGIPLKHARLALTGRTTGARSSGPCSPRCRATRRCGGRHEAPRHPHRRAARASARRGRRDRVLRLRPDRL